MRAPVVALVAVQVLLPTVMLASRWAQEGARPRTERPASWQMYSHVPPASYEGVDGSGRVRSLSTHGLPLLVRAVDTGDLVPRRLCRRDADLILVRRTEGPQPGEWSC